MIRQIVAACSVVLLLSAADLGAATDIADAARNENIEAVRSLLQQQNVDVNSPQPDGATALHWAVQRNDLEMAELLIRAGANVAAANRNGATPMTLACLNGNAAMIDKLLKAGADANGAVLLNGETPLMMAARTGNPDAVKVLLDQGAKVNAAESLRETTALMWAVAEDHADVAELLIKRGADVSARSKVTALPPRRGERDSNLPAGYVDGVSALIVAVRERAVDSVRVLIKAGADPNQTAADHTSPMLVAALNGDYDVAAILLENGGDPNIANDTAWTPLYVAVKNRNIDTGVVPLPTASELPALEFIHMLLDNGANPNIRVTAATPRRADNYPGWAWAEAGATPFLRAAVGGDLEAMRLLLAYGADPTITTNDNMTPLMAASGLGWAQGFNHEHSESMTLEAVGLLLNLGADVNALRNDGATALHGAAHKGSNRVVQLLVDHGADLTIKDKGRNMESVKLIPLDYALGVTFTLTTTMAHADTADLIRKLMTERGIPILDSGERSVGGDDGSLGRNLAADEEAERRTREAARGTQK